MRHMNRTLHLFALIILFLSACSADNAGDPLAAQTAAVQTLDAQLSLAQAQETLFAEEAQETAFASELNALNTQTAEIEIELGQTQAAQSTFEAIQHQLIAPSGAICRMGPQSAFPEYASIVQGESVNIFERDINGDWWHAQLSDGSTCWIFWAADIEFEGDVFNLPLAQGPRLPTSTPVPTRAPGFTLNFHTDHLCNGTQTGVFTIRNVGPDTYESVRIGIIDPATGSPIRYRDGNSEFLSNGGSCSKGASTLVPGESAFLTISFGGTKDGDSLRVNVRLCTENGLGGSCISGNREFIR